MREYLETYWPKLHAKWLNDSGPGASGIPVLNQTDESTSTKKTLKLTFDDGPTPFGTRVLLDLLDRHQVRATFFVVGQNAVRYPELILEMEAGGHVIGNHSFDHLNPWRISARSMMRDYEKCNEVLASITNRQPRWIRPPFGRARRRTIQWCHRKGIDVVLWNVSLADTNTSRSLRELREFAMRYIKPGSILRLHDNEESLRITPALLEVLIPFLKNEGWQFETLESESQLTSKAA